MHFIISLQNPFLIPETNDNDISSRTRSRTHLTNENSIHTNPHHQHNHYHTTNNNNTTSQLIDETINNHFLRRSTRRNQQSNLVHQRSSANLTTATSSSPASNHPQQLNSTNSATSSRIHTRSHRSTRNSQNFTSSENSSSNSSFSTQNLTNSTPHNTATSSRTRHRLHHQPTQDYRQTSNQNNSNRNNARTTNSYYSIRRNTSSQHPAHQTNLASQSSNASHNLSQSAVQTPYLTRQRSSVSSNQEYSNSTTQSNFEDSHQLHQHYRSANYTRSHTSNSDSSSTLDQTSIDSLDSGNFSDSIQQEGNSSSFTPPNSQLNNHYSTTTNLRVTRGLYRSGIISDPDIDVEISETHAKIRLGTLHLTVSMKNHKILSFEFINVKSLYHDQVEENELNLNHTSSSYSSYYGSGSSGQAGGHHFPQGLPLPEIVENCLKNLANKKDNLYSIKVV